MKNLADIENYTTDIEYIKKCHEGQVDKQGQPYYLHPVNVAKNVIKLFRYLFLLNNANLADCIKAALLHDVVEDTPVTLEDLYAEGYSDTVCTMVDLLSCDMDAKKILPDGSTMKYTDRVQKIIDSGNWGAIIVKLADNMDNDRPDRRLVWTHKKYVKTIPKLVEALGLPREDFAEYFPTN